MAIAKGAGLTTLVGVPIDSAGYPNGLERMPDALRDAGLPEKLALRDGGNLPVLIDSRHRDPLTGIIGFPEICRASEIVRSHLGRLLGKGERPFLLGGDCTLLIGVSAALRERFGPVGLAFIDGHLDCYDGRSSPTGETADMELAVLLGHGPAGLVDLAGAPPLVAPEHVAAVGFRDGDEAARDGALDPSRAAPGITLVDARAVRERGPGEVGRELRRRFDAASRPFWLHLDLDVLDKDVLPAVDYPMPNGLDWGEAAELVTPLAHSPALAGMDVTIYNPRLDPGNKYAAPIVDWLAAMLIGSS